MKITELLKKTGLFFLIVLVALSCNKDEEEVKEPVSNERSGTFTVDAQLKDEIKINLTGKEFELDEILAETIVIVNDVDGQEVLRENYLDLIEPVSLPPGDYDLLVIRKGNDRPNFDDPTYVNADYRSGGTRFSVRAITNTPINVPLVLDHVKIIMNISDAVIRNYPDIKVDVIDPDPVDSTSESQKLTWSVVENGQSGYVLIEGESVNLVVSLLATDPNTGQIVSGTNTYEGVTSNQRYQLAVELGEAEQNGSFSIRPSLETETVIDDVVLVGNNTGRPQSDYEVLKLLYDSNPGNTLPWDLSDITMKSWGNGVQLDVNGRVTALRIRGRGLTIIPPELGNLSNLQELGVSGNVLSSVPAELGNLANLQKLNLSSNQLSSVPAELGNLANLEVLTLGLNEMLSIPVSLTNLTSLRELYLNDSPLERIPSELGRLTNLEVLFLEKNQLTEVPAELGNLTKLLYLDLDENLLSEIPSNLGALSNLKTLDLGVNQLIRIPVELGNLESLKSLDLRENLLEEIPAELGNLKNLSSLDIKRNPVRKIPQTVCDLFGSSLTGLRIDDGFFSEYERDFCE